MSFKFKRCLKIEIEDKSTDFNNSINGILAIEDIGNDIFKVTIGSATCDVKGSDIRDFIKELNRMVN